MKRRTILTGAALLSVAPLAYLFARRPSASPQSPLSVESGPLLLRPGFHCTVLDRAGSLQSDGTQSPLLPDGMACFAGPHDTWILLRNHELDRNARGGAYPHGAPPEAYRADAHGGVSRLVLRPSDLQVLRTNMVLTGTMRNCAGGPSPWGWLSCEESNEAEHGYVFCAPLDAETVQPARPLVGYGRFRHEAVALDLQTFHAYLTEDEPDGCFYRFVPHTRERPFEGQLFALRVSGIFGEDTSKNLRPGQRVPVDWVRIPDPEARQRSTRKQAQEQGAALFRRGEGCWSDEHSVVFTATTGGLKQKGQIFRLHWSREPTQPDILEVIAEASSTEDWKHPDNITIAPWGDIIFAEDGRSHQHLRGLTPSGEVYPIAQNALSHGELAGVCFSPDGSTLFCNLQVDGLTVAIRGPWDRLSASTS